VYVKNLQDKCSLETRHYKKKARKALISNSGSGSIPKCFGSGTLLVNMFCKAFYKYHPKMQSMHKQSPKNMKGFKKTLKHNGR
jgi:hypothetical protein